MAEYIDLNNTEVLAEAGENAKLVVEEDGELKRIPASAVGQVKTVNGVEPDEAGNVTFDALPTGATAHQQLVTDGEGKAKWEDKAFYETIQYDERYGTDNLNCVEMDGWYVAMEAFSVSFDASKQYVVEQYPEYVCDVKTDADIGTKYIGNTTLSGFGEDTGEPFFVVENSGMATVALKEAPASQLFYLQEVVVTIKPIDEKFIPGACVKKITLPEDVAPSVLKAAVDALNNGNAIVMWGSKRIVEGVVGIPDRYAYLRFADHSLYGGEDEIAGYYSWSGDNWPVDAATLNLFEGVIEYPNSFRLRSSSGDKVYQITVDDSGTLTTTEV